MIYCPRCRQEYEPNIERCADCGVTLVPELPPARELAREPDVLAEADGVAQVDASPAEERRPRRSWRRPPPPPPPFPRRTLLFEMLVVLMVTWAPIFIGNLAFRSRHPEGVDSRTSPSDPGSLALSLAMSAGRILLIVYLVWRNGEPLAVIGIRRTRWWAELAWAAVIWMTHWIILRVVRAGLHGAASLAQCADLAQHSPAGGWAMQAAAILALLVGVASEEVLYRGYLLTRLQQETQHAWLAILLAAVPFTYSHPYHSPELVQLLASGIMFGVFSWYGRSLPRLVLAHFAYDLWVRFA